MVNMGLNWISNLLFQSIKLNSSASLLKYLIEIFYNHNNNYYCFETKTYGINN